MRTRIRGWAAGRSLHFSALCALLLPLVGGCSGQESTAPVEQEVQGIPDVPVPAADGPKLVITRHRVIVRDRPSHGGNAIGTLRLGAAVARAAKPFSKFKCPGGWFPIRPRGFVCAGAEASTDEAHPSRAALGAGPHLDQVLPYRYAKVARGAAVAYETLPSAEQQQQAEPKQKRRPSAANKLSMGAIDVPLDAQGMPAGPPVLMPDGIGVGADGQRTREGFFGFPSMVEMEVGASFRGDADTRVMKAGSGVALANVVNAASDENMRDFGVMPDGRLVPVDRLKPVLGTAWHGMNVIESGLPVAFSIRRGVSLYHLERGKATRQDEELDPRQGVVLTGRFRTVNGIKYFFLEEQQLWVRAAHVIYLPKRSKFPDFATPEQKWVDVSLANQTMVAYQGRKPVYATMVSSGRDQLGDPAEGPSTKQGVFRIKSKHITLSLDDREVEQRYTVDDAPWVLEFEEGFWISGCYWHSRFGEARGFHNLSLAPVDAHWLWSWAQPDLPEGWHGVMVDEKSANTVIYVHR